ncbi:MAG: peptidylprolyl isomerase [Candidatus Thiodiazotropha sp.]
MMKKKMLLATFCSALLIAGCNQAADTAPTVPSPDTTSNAEQEQPAMDENTLLTVNGEPISKPMYALYFQDRMRNVPDAQNSPQMQMTVLNELANVIIAAQDAESKGIAERPEIAATLALLRAKLLTQTVIQEYASEHQPSEDQIKTYYEAEYASQSNQEYKARHILVKEEAEAKALIEELDGGADFAELAKAHSTGPTGKNGGDLGWFDANQMVKPFADAVAAMEKGGYSKEPVQTQFGWHVIQLEDTRQAEAPTLESVRGEIITKLQQQALADYMQQLRSNSDIVFNEQMAVKKPAAEEDTASQTEDEKSAESTPAEGAAASQTEGEKPSDAAAAEEEAKPASE